MFCETSFCSLINATIMMIDNSRLVANATIAFFMSLPAVDTLDGTMFSIDFGLVYVKISFTV
jgi:hypothetical protein